MGPKAKYQSELNGGLIWHDALQGLVVNEFQRLHDELESPPRQWFWQKRTTLQGIYIYGSVGRGKTHLMDLFYDTLPENVGKKRQHFHEFMLWLHHQLQSNKQHQNPINLICQQLAESVDVVCLDEFLVNDIADAMLLSGLLVAFLKHGITLVTTSNVKPDDLYHDGLQRAKFLPAIDWIKQHLQVLHLDGEQDYRIQANGTHEHWYYPINESSYLRLHDHFIHHNDSNEMNNQPWCINDRVLPITKAAGKNLWCHFDALCKDARSASDYIAIAEQIDTLYIEGIPKLSIYENDSSRRFITLIDVLYENEIKIIAQADTHYKMLYQGEKLAFEFKRCASRLSELLI